MDDVERGVPAHGVARRILGNVVRTFETGDERAQLGLREIHDEVRVGRSAWLAKHRARDRAADGVGKLEVVEDCDDVQVSHGLSKSMA
jgi:hypothetical protein